MLPVEDQHLQNREECGASGGNLRYFPLALSFQDDFVTNGRVVIIVLFYYTITRLATDNFLFASLLSFC